MKIPRSILVLSVLLIVGAAWFVLSEPNISMPDAIRDKYKHLFDLQIENLPDGSKKLHNGRLWSRAGLKILSLKGDKFEMAYQHGRLLRDYNAKENLELTADILVRGSRNMFGKDSLVTKVIVKGSYRFITLPMLEGAIDEVGGDRDSYLSVAWGLSEGSGASVVDVIRAGFGTESIFVALGLTTKKPDGQPLVGGEATSNCSAFSVWGDATKNGELLVGRNTDFPLTGYYDRYATVIYFEPSDGAQRFMAVTAAGFHNAGVTGMNESGIFVGTHTVPTHEVSRTGMPVFFIGQEILREAKTLEDAINIFKKRKSAAGWAYFIVSTKEGRGVTVEVTSDKVEFIRHANSHAEQTNHFVSKKMIDSYLSVNPSVDRDSVARRKRLIDVIDEKKGKFTKEDALRLLGDKHEAYTGKISAIGNVIATHFTVSSVVVVPSEDKILVANGNAPVSQNLYLELPVPAAFDPNTFSSYPVKLFDPSDHDEMYPNMAKAEKLYIAAKNAYEYHGDVKLALEIVNKVVRLDDTNTIYWFVLGVLNLKDDNYTGAVKAFDNAIRTGREHHRISVATYYRARAKAYIGEQIAAKVELNKLLGNEKLASTLKDVVQDTLEDIGDKESMKFKYRELGVLMHIGDVQNY